MGGTKEGDSRDLHTLSLAEVIIIESIMVVIDVLSY